MVITPQSTVWDFAPTSEELAELGLAGYASPADYIRIGNQQCQDPDFFRLFHILDLFELRGDAESVAAVEHIMNTDYADLMARLFNE